MNKIRLFSTAQNNPVTPIETPKTPWETPMPSHQFDFMQRVLSAPSPIGLEASMTKGVIKPYIDQFMDKNNWTFREFKGHAALIADTDNDHNEIKADEGKLRIMVVGHADKIRMQVKKIGDDGKVWISSDSFLPMTLLGNEVVIFSEDIEELGKYRKIQGATVEALGAIHFADPKLRSGDMGIKSEQLYLELHVHGEKKKEQVEKLGIRPGDSILLNRPIRKGVMKNTFTGSYLDNGLGCFVTAEVAKILAEENVIKKTRCLFTFSTYEEIGRFGSRVLANMFKPDILIAVDVNHDYIAAPGVSSKKYPPLEMGKGFTLSVGSIVSEQLNTIIERVSKEKRIPIQRDMVGIDTGTDAMSGVLGAIDCASTSIGFPIRNMHTISEAAHTGDVIASIHAIVETIKELERIPLDSLQIRKMLKESHPRLDLAKSFN